MPELNTKTFNKNQAWLQPGDHVYNTVLPPVDEARFRIWVEQNKVPFDIAAPVSDYDMRGFWKALQAGDPNALTAINPNDKELHYPDYWKTPYHESFSVESQWADPTKAPSWNDKDQLVLPDGKIVFDERKSVQMRAQSKASDNVAGLQGLGKQ